MRKHAYRATSVKRIVLKEVLLQLAEGPVVIGLDIGKRAIFVVVRDSSGKFQRPWKVRSPHEVPVLVQHAKALSQSRPVRIALESTGTYGDPVRQALTDAGLEVHRVGTKASCDYKEIFDGVPSSHDGKDAAVVAELAALGKSSPWPTREEALEEAEMAAQVRWLDSQQEILMLWLGQLESLLARYWPELTGLLELNSATLLRLLAHYGGPAALAADPEGAAQLARWGRALLREAKIAAVIESAQATIGVRMQAAHLELLQNCAQRALDARREIQEARKKLEALGKADKVVQAMSEAVGLPTACVLRVAVGNPEDFHCGEAYRKAMGLNLKERSSGQHQGKLRITKRGSALARRWLYFAALRIIQKSPVRRWYEAKKAKDRDRGTGAIVGVMRKLALAVYKVAACGETFEVERLFPGNPPRGSAAL